MTLLYPKLSKCYNCDLQGFFCTTPYDYDDDKSWKYFSTCPICDGYNDLETRVELKVLNSKYDDNELTLQWCNTCRIMYDTGCTHASNHDTADTDDVTNCHVIDKWRDKKTGEENVGMPQFKNIDQWRKRVNDIDIISMTCLNKGLHCNKSSYENNDTCYLIE